MAAQRELPRVVVATIHDAHRLSTLREALFGEVGQPLAPGAAPQFLVDSRDAFARTIESAQCVAWLAEDDRGEAIASLAMLVLPRLPTPKSRRTTEGYLLSVYTKPEWRKRGVAAALVAASIAHARAHGFARIRLHATDAGRAVYAAAGFASRLDEMELKLDG